jgi:predicted transcriptional regulator
MEAIDREKAFITVDEAARELGTTPTRVLMMLRSKELLGREADGGWLVAAASLACARVHGTDRKEASGCAAYCKSKCDCG